MWYVWMVASFLLGRWLRQASKMSLLCMAVISNPSFKAASTTASIYWTRVTKRPPGTPPMAMRAARANLVIVPSRRDQVLPMS